MTILHILVGVLVRHFFIYHSVAPTITSLFYLSKAAMIKR